MKNQTGHYLLNSALSGLFAFISLAGCALAFLMLATSGTASGETSFEMIPCTLGPLVAGLGSMALLALNRRVRANAGAMFIILTFWLVGIIVFFFGITAVFLYEEPNEFLPNLGFAIAFCLTPGGLLTLLALATYGSILLPAPPSLPLRSGKSAQFCF